MKKGKMFLAVVGLIGATLVASCSTTQNAQTDVQKFNADLACILPYEVNTVGSYVASQLPTILVNGTSGLAGGALATAVLALQDLPAAIAHCHATSPMLVTAMAIPIPTMPSPAASSTPAPSATPTPIAK